MKKETPKKKVKKTEHRQIELRESLAKAFQDVLRNAARKNQQLALSIEGKIVVIDARKLKSILTSHRHNGHTVESEILQFAQVKHS